MTDLVERAARAALEAFNGDDEAMADALMAAPEHTLSTIARAIIPSVLEDAAKDLRAKADAACLDDWMQAMDAAADWLEQRANEVRP